MKAKTFTLTIPGTPQPIKAGAPCANRHTGGAYIRSNEQSNKEKFRIGELVKARIEEMGGFEPFSGAIQATVNYYFQKPKHKIRKNSTPFPFVDCKPDVDNLQKVTYDGVQRANGKKREEVDTIAWQDDAQIIGCKVNKLWCIEDEEPRTELKLIEVDCPDVWVLYLSMLNEADDVLEGGVA